MSPDQAQLLVLVLLVRLTIVNNWVKKGKMELLLLLLVLLQTMIPRP